jgi:hypothetical protein
VINLAKPKIIEDIENLQVEVTNARNGKANLKTKIDEIDTTLTSHTSQLADIVTNVRSFGAKGDGITDDTTFIQTSLDNGKGKRVHFPRIAGQTTTTYLVSYALYVSEKTIVSADYGVIIKRKDNTISDSIATLTWGNNVFNVGYWDGTKYASYSATSPASWVKFENIEIDGNCQNQSGYTVMDFNKGGWGISLRYVKNATVRDCKIHHCFAGGLMSTMTHGLNLDNVECSYNCIQNNFLDTGNGFDIQGLPDTTNPELRNHITISNCKSHQNADNGFTISIVSDVTLVNCHAWDNGNSTYSDNSALGFELTGATTTNPQKIQVSNCSSVNNVRTGSTNNSGFRLNSSGTVDKIQINNFISTGQTGYGLDLCFASASVGNVQLSNIMVDWVGTNGQALYGVVVYRLASTNIENIQMSNVVVKNGISTASGIGILSNYSGTMKNVQMSNVICNNNASYGITMVGNIENIQMNDCTVLNATSDGFSVSAGSGYTMKSVLMQGCVAKSCTRDGIAFYPNAGTIDYATINNCVSNLNRYGITTTAMLSKLKIDDLTQFDSNTTGAVNINCPSNRATSMPSSGTWAIGDFVTNTNISEQGTAGSKYIVRGWSRITTGSGNVLNTDWVTARMLTGN